MTDSTEINYVLISVDEIERIRPMWYGQRAVHAEDSPYFKEYFYSRTFEGRCSKFFRMDKENVRIEIAQSGKEDIGYCISSISAENDGEIDSIFLKEECRSHGIGSALMSHALAWMDEHGITERKVMVGFGREIVCGFYEKFGFYPRLVQLDWKGKK